MAFISELCGKERNPHPPGPSDGTPSDVISHTVSRDKKGQRVAEWQFPFPRETCEASQETG